MQTHWTDVNTLTEHMFVLPHFFYVCFFFKITVRLQSLVFVVSTFIPIVKGESDGYTCKRKGIFSEYMWLYRQQA